MANTHTFSKGEEIANSITHGIGWILSIAALVLLVVFSSLHGNVWHVVSFTLFGVTMVFLYTSSTMLHSLPQGKAKDVFEILDHSSIYYFIAGSYTPFLFIVVDGWVSWTLFGVLWGIAAGGTVFKSFYVKKFLVTSTLLYVVMGWMMIFIWKPVFEFLPSQGILFLIIGGLSYTFGSVFYVWRAFKYHHALWHLFVIVGTAFHFFVVFLYLLPWG